MIQYLIKHQWRESIRSPLWARKVASNIFLGIMLLLTVINLLGLGLIIDRILKDTAPDVDLITLLNGLVLYYFLIELLMRILLQKVHGLIVQPYMHLPIRRTRLVHYLLLKSIMSLFNILPLLVFVPASFKIIGVQSTTSAWVWLFAIFTLMLCNNYVALFLKRLGSVNTTIVLVIVSALAAFIVLDYFKILSISSISSGLFAGLLSNYAWLIGPIVLLLFIYGLNYSFLKSRVYLEELGRGKERKEVTTTRYTFLDRFGDLGEFIGLELKLILRHKRLKSFLFLLPLIFLFGFYFHGREGEEVFDILVIYLGIFLTGMFMLHYGQFVLSWESHYFDAILSQKINHYLYLKAKFIILTVSCLLLFLLLTPIAYFGIDMLWKYTAVVLFNMGINSFVLLFKGTYNRQKLDLNASAMTMQGKDAKQIFVAMLLVILPILIYLPFKIMAVPNLGLMTIAAIGLLGLIFHEQLLKLIVIQFERQKYKVAAAFRQS